MADPKESDADQLAFWNGIGGRIWVDRKEHTDATLAAATKALLDRAAPRPGEQVLEIGCGCGTLARDMANAVGPTGQVIAVDISEPMVAEAQVRAKAAGISNIRWQVEDAAIAQLESFDVLVSNLGAMFFGDPVAAYTHLRGAANPGARMVLLTWRPLDHNPWLEVPMRAVAQHLPPRPKRTPNAPGMFAFANPEYVEQVLSAAGWSEPTLEKLDFDLDLAAGKGLEEAVTQTTQIGAVNSWLRNESDEIKAAAIESLREAFVPHVNGEHVRLPGAFWLIRSMAP